MRVHFDVLGWLWVLMGSVGILTAISLSVLVFGSLAALAAIGGNSGPMPSAVWLMALGAAGFGIGGLMMAVVGRSVIARGTRGRHSALAMAVPSLFVVPFGTALSVYTFWTLLNDEARREFGRPLRASRR